MKLPELPRQNKKKEADFGVEFRKWWNKYGKGEAYELKDTRGKNSLAFSEVDNDQLTVGLASFNKKVLIRVSSGTIGAPDYIGIKNQDYWIVIKYPDFFCLIHILDWCNELKVSDRKSLTATRAKEIATIIV